MNAQQALAELVSGGGSTSRAEVAQTLRTAVERTGGLAALRRAADILAAGDGAPRWLRPLGTELFRSQSEFNHAVVDVLEDLPWLAGQPSPAERAQRRLAPGTRFSARPPRRGGLRGAAVFLAKSAALLAAERRERPLLEQLRQSNAWLTELVGLAAGGKPLGALGHAPPLTASDTFAPWRSAQGAFVAATLDLLRAHARALTSRAAAVQALPAPAPAPSAHPSVTVLYAGHGAPPKVEGALEVLGESDKRDVAAARGEVIVRLPPGEALLPGGLATLAAAFADPSVKLAYGDALAADGTAQFRPGWSPETLLGWTYPGGCFAVRTEAARAAKLSRNRPALDWLLAPRFTESQVRHLPRFISKVANAAPSVAELMIVEAELARLGAGGVVRVHGALREVRLSPQAGTRVSIIVPFKDKAELLAGLWASLCRVPAGVEWELLLANNGSTERATARFLSGLGDARVRVIDWNHPFNYSAINNAAARHASGDVLLFLNNDVEALHEGWLGDLAGHAQLPGVGVVGARLSYADGSTQHAGVVIGLRGLAGHVFARWRPEYGPTPFGPPDLTRNWSAVTGACLMIRKPLFVELGGFDERLAVSGGDVALCLAAREKGLRVVCVGHVELAHYESQSRGRESVPRSDVLREALLYGPLLERGDPYYHPLLTAEAGHGGPGLQVEDPAEHALRALAPWVT
jgi:Glycosyl transferase family 2